MKKTLLTLMCALFCLGSVAQKPGLFKYYDFNETVSYDVSVDKQLPSTTQALESVQHIVDSRMDLSDKFIVEDFTIPAPTASATSLPLGQVSITDFDIITGPDGISRFTYEGTYTFDVSNLPAESPQEAKQWFTDVPVKLEGKFQDNKLYAVFSMKVSMTVGASTHLLAVTATYGTDNFTTPADEGKVYTEPLVVTINEVSTEPQDADVTVYSNTDGTIDFELKNFVLNMGSEDMPIGNIRVDNLTTTEGEDGLTHFSFNGSIFITEGDAEGVDQWYGPLLCMDEEGNPKPIPVVLNGKMNDTKLYVTIDINMEALGQVIFVQVGTDTFFETNYTEPYVVSVNQGEFSEPVDANITVKDNRNNTIDFILRDFSLELMGQTIPMGDVTLQDVAIEEGEDGLTSFSKEGTFNIPTSGMPKQFALLVSAGVFNNVPFTLKGKYNAEKLYATIDITVQAVQSQQIKVVVGTEFPVTIVGDVNGDTHVDIADAVSILNIMAEGTDDPIADINGDTHVDIADFVSVLNIMAEQ